MTRIDTFSFSSKIEVNEQPIKMTHASCRWAYHLFLWTTLGIVPNPPNKSTPSHHPTLCFSPSPPPPPPPSPSPPPPPPPQTQNLVWIPLNSKSCSYEPLCSMDLPLLSWRVLTVVVWNVTCFFWTKVVTVLDLYQLHLNLQGLQYLSS